jgi:hypothetical protein
MQLLAAAARSRCRPQTHPAAVGQCSRAKRSMAMVLLGPDRLQVRRAMVYWLEEHVLREVLSKGGDGEVRSYYCCCCTLQNGACPSECMNHREPRTVRPQLKSSTDARALFFAMEIPVESRRDTSW